MLILLSKFWGAVQGVSIVILVKEQMKKEPCKVYHLDVWGIRENKYQYLNENDLSTSGWVELKQVSKSSCLGDFYFFTPKAFDNVDEYCQGVDLQRLFPENQNGIKTDRDSLFFDFEHDVLQNRMKIFYSNEGLKPQFREKYNVTNSSSYDLLTRRERTSFDDTNIRKCLYRPFDKRWLYYQVGLTSRPAFSVMRHMLHENLALICLRQTRRDEKGTFFVADGLINKDAVSLFDIGTVFPLYLYPDPNKATLFDTVEGEWTRGKNGRTPNLNPKFIREMEGKLCMRFVYDDVPNPSPNDGEGLSGDTFTPEDVFAYAYAVFHSPEYRSRYAEFLKIDFPRLPLTSDAALFKTLAGLGRRLVDLHLLRADIKAITQYPVEGDNVVGARGFPVYDAKTGRVKINATQYFENVPENVWHFHVGGYQVLEKWLKDRRGRSLSFDDLIHYAKIVAALAETIKVMEAIDEAIPAFPME